MYIFDNKIHKRNLAISQAKRVSSRTQFLFHIDNSVGSGLCAFSPEYLHYTLSDTMVLKDRVFFRVEGDSLRRTDIQIVD
jgi:hypothetical protein